MHSSRPLAAASAALTAFLQLPTSRPPLARAAAIACMKIGHWFAQPPVRGLVASLLGVILCCAINAASADEPLKLPDSQLEPIKWTEVAGWRADDHLAAFAAYQTSCQALHKTRQNDGRRLSGAL